MNPKEVYDQARDSFREGVDAAAKHFPGHEMYAVERYLECLCLLALYRHENDHRGAEWIAPDAPY